MTTIRAIRIHKDLLWEEGTTIAKTIWLPDDSRPATSADRTSPMQIVQGLKLLEMVNTWFAELFGETYLLHGISQAKFPYFLPIGELPSIWCTLNRVRSAPRGILCQFAFQIRWAREQHPPVATGRFNVYWPSAPRAGP